MLIYICMLHQLDSVRVIEVWLTPGHSYKYLGCPCRPHVFNPREGKEGDTGVADIRTFTPFTVEERRSMQTNVGTLVLSLPLKKLQPLVNYSLWMWMQSFVNELTNQGQELLRMMILNMLSWHAENWREAIKMGSFFWTCELYVNLLRSITKTLVSVVPLLFVTMQWLGAQMWPGITILSFSSPASLPLVASGISCFIDSLDNQTSSRAAHVEDSLKGPLTV